MFIEILLVPLNRLDLHFRYWQKLKQPPVFELVAATVHRTVAAGWVEPVIFMK